MQAISAAIVASLFALHSSDLQARSLSEPLYVEPFDRGAGSTVLTRASREGMMYGNPALISLGSPWIRWFGLQSTMKARGNTPKLTELYNQNKANFEGDAADLVDFADAVDIGVGPEVSFSFLNEYFSVNSFVDLSTYFKYEAFGKVGIPGSRAILEALGAFSTSLSYAPARWLSLGLTYSKVGGIYRDLVITPLNSSEAIETFEDLESFGTGDALTGGLLLISRGYTFDYSLGIVAKNIGGLKFSDDTHPSFPATIDAGLGFAIHTKGSVIDWSLELEDVIQATPYPLSERLKFGVRFLAWQHIGLALGYRYRTPTAAITVDAYLLKLTIGTSTQRVGLGENSLLRSEYTLTLTTGY